MSGMPISGEVKLKYHVISAVEPPGVDHFGRIDPKCGRFGE